MLLFTRHVVSFLLAILLASNAYAAVYFEENKSSGFARVLFPGKTEADFDVTLTGRDLRIKFSNVDLFTDLFELKKQLPSYVEHTSISYKDKTLNALLVPGNNYELKLFSDSGIIGFDIVKVVDNYQPQPSKKPIAAVVQKASPDTDPIPLFKPIIKELLDVAVIEGKEEYEPTAQASDEDIANVLANELIISAVDESLIGPQRSDLLLDEKPQEAVEPKIEAEAAPDQLEPEIEPAELTQEESTDSTLALKLSWQKDAALAVFFRGENLWIIADQYKKIDLDEVRTKFGQAFSSVIQLDNKNFTILKLHARQNIKSNISVSKEDKAWLLSLTEDKYTPSSIMDMHIVDNELHGSKVNFPSENADMKYIRILDEDVGDQIIVIPYKTHGKAVSIPWKYTDYTIYPTLQGVAIELISDRVDIEIEKYEIYLSGPTNRLASNVQSTLREIKEREREARYRAERLKQKSQEFALYKFKTWSTQLQDDTDFNDLLKKLQDDVIAANWQNKSEPRLNLARFFLANYMGHEAYGVIKTMASYDPEFANSNDVKIISGAAHFMMGRYEESVAIYDSMDLSQYSQFEVEEVNFWRSAAILEASKKIKMDRLIAKNPLEKKKDILDSGDRVEITKLVLETSSRLLKIIKKMDPEFVNTKEVQTLESTARFVADHYQEAIRRFEETDLFRSGDAFEAEEKKLWWGVSDKQGSETVDLNFLPNQDRFLKYYPDDKYNDFALLSLEEKLQRNDLASAEEILFSFRDDDREHFKNSVNFFKGLFYAKDEEDDRAIETWSEVSEQVLDSYNRTRAQYAKAIFMLDKKRITVSEAIDMLNKIRVSWRGGILELSILKILGDLYINEKQYKDGMTVWREIISSFPGSEESLLIAKKMNDKFVQLFNQGEVDEMPQLQALILFYEFRELTPIGRVGDEMISKLADRLIEVDLLGRAAALLTHQVRFRLSGEERDKVSTKLVKIHLLNQKPRKALDVLNATDHDIMDEEIALERRYLRSMSLIELNKNNSVLGLLRGDERHEAYYLRAEVYWRNNIWRKVIEELEVPFRQIRREERTLSEKEASQLVRLSVAYALENRRKKLKILFEDFYPHIPGQHLKDVFEFVATDRGPVDFKDLEYTVELNDMKVFLDEYMKKGNVFNKEG